MRTFDFLYFFALCIRILNLFSKLSNIHPIIINDILDELFFSFVLPEEWCIRPLIFAAIFCDIIAYFVQVKQYLWRIFENILIIANFIVLKTLMRLYLLLFNCFSVRVLLFLHSNQHLVPLLFVNLKHFVLHLSKTTHHIIDWADYFWVDCFYQIVSGRFVGQFGRIVSL